MGVWILSKEITNRKSQRLPNRRSRLNAKSGYQAELRETRPWRLGPPPYLYGRGTHQRVRLHLVACRESPVRLLLGNPSLLADLGLIGHHRAGRPRLYRREVIWDVVNL